METDGPIVVGVAGSRFGREALRWRWPKDNGGTAPCGR
jgi:hypothetical protein